MANKDKNRRRFRFGLKFLLAIITVTCLWFGYYASQTHQRRKALAHVAELGGATWKLGQIAMPKTSKSESTWENLTRKYDELLVTIFGESVSRDIVAVDLSNASTSATDLSQLHVLDEVEWLTVSGNELDDNAIEKLRPFQQLRWLDISGSQVTVEGVKNLKQLNSLEWLNISDTRIDESDYSSLQSLFPNAELGTSSKRSLTTSPTKSRSSTDLDATTSRLWTDFLGNPYSDDVLKEYLDSIQRSSAINFPSWYISGVFRANRKGLEPLLAIEIYNGTRTSFNLGCLLVFGPNGELLREIAEERIHWSLGGPTKEADWYDEQSSRIQAQQLAASQQKIIDLADLTGDGFDEIPTERWNRTVGQSSGDSTSIYSTKTEDIPCLFCVAIIRQPTGNLLVDLNSMAPNLIYRELESGKLFLQTPCYAPTPTGTALMGSMPQRTLAAFRWDESTETFIGPFKGPQNTWKVLELD